MSEPSPPRFNPFPGLRPFRSDESHLFFGREEQASTLLHLLRQNRFLAVVGTSGSGKSSLVRAGLIPELHGGTMARAGSAWEVIVMRPGGSPFKNLASSLVEADLYDADNPHSLPRLQATLSRSRYGLVEAVKQSDLVGPEVNVLLVVDQFEELFRFRQQGLESEEAATAFVNLLLTASEQSECQVYVTITMRSDYLGDCAEIPGLAEAVNKGEYLIPRLQRDQKQDAIVRPIEVGGAKIAPLLVQRLLNDVGDDPDQLPVLQHALMRMWDVWAASGDSARPLDFSDLEATGGLADALSRHADEIYEALPEDRHRDVCMRVFKALTEKGSDNRGIRRPTRLERLEAIIGTDRSTLTAVLDAFRAPGVTFLMPGINTELGDRTVVDLSHESLMRGWQRLRTWVEEEAQSARIFQRLSETASLWGDGKAGLFRDPDLQIALSWQDDEDPNTDWAVQYGGDLEAAIDFLQKSRAEAEAEKSAQEAARKRELEQAQQLAEEQRLRLEHQQRSARRQRVMIGGLSVVALIAAIALLMAVIANSRARELAAKEALAASAAEASADAAEASAQEADRAREQMRTERDDLGQRYYLMSLFSADKAIQENKLSRAALELDQCKNRYRGWEWRFLYGRAQSAPGDHLPGDGPACFTSDGQRWISRGTRTMKHKAFVRDLSSGRLLAEFSHESDLSAIALSPDDQWLAALQDGGMITLWNLETQQQEWALPILPDWGRSLAFSPDGLLIAASSAEGTLKVIQAADGTPSFTIPLEKPGKITFSHDGRWLCVAASPPVIVGIATGGIAARLPARAERPIFSPQAPLLATASHDDQSITLWTWDGRELLKERSWKSAPSTRLQDLCFHPDGTQVVSAQAGHLMVWNVANGRAVTGVHTDWMGSLAVSPMGQTVSFSENGGIRIWRYGGEDPEVVTRPHENESRLVQFSPDGNRVAVGPHRGQQELSVNETAGPVVILDSRTGALISKIEVPCRGFSWMPDSRQLVVTRDDEGSHELYDAATGSLVLAFEGGYFAEGRPYVDRSGKWVTSVGSGGPHPFPIRRWDTSTGKPGELFEFDLFWGGGNPGWPVGGYTNATVSPDGFRVAIGSGGTGGIWDLRTSSFKEVSMSPRIAETLEFTSDGNRLYAATGREHFRLFDFEGEEAEVDFVGPSGQISMSEDQRYIVSSGEGVVIWDVASGIPIITLSNDKSLDFISVGWSADGQRVAAGRVDGSVHIWTLITDLQLLADQAREHEEREEWAEAAAKWAQVAKEDPNGARLLAGVAERLEAGGESLLAASGREQARTVLQAALQAEPGNYFLANRIRDLDVTIIRAHGQSGRVDEGVAAATRAIEEASSPEAIGEIIGRLGGCSEILSKVLALQPEDSPLGPAHALGIADVFASDADWKQALVYYDLAIAKEPANASALTGRGIAHAEAGNHAKAAIDWKRALELATDRTLHGKISERIRPYADSVLKQQLMISAGASWRYDDSGEDPGTAWRETAFDDLTWKVGPAPLGYSDSPATTLSFGEDPSQKHATAYFRHQFKLADPGSTNALLLKLDIDDGCVVYLNGAELVRQNMPEGEVSHTMWAARAISGDAEKTWSTFILGPLQSLQAENVLAVEVHQVSESSSDLRFDLEMFSFHLPK